MAGLAELPAVEKVRGARLKDHLLVGYARMPDHPAKLRMLRGLSRTFNPRPELRLPGGARIVIGTDDYIGWSLIKEGGYEPQSLALATHLLAQMPGPFVDVGANVGLFTLVAASIPGTRVVAIEPDCDSCARLRANIRLNGFSNITIFNGAVGKETGVVAIEARSANNAGSLFTSNRVGEPSSVRDWVPMLTLEHVLASVLAGKGRPVLMKLDIEGAEPDALAGLAWSGAHRPRNIIFEYNTLSARAWGSFDGMRAFFVEQGYGLQTVTGAPIAQSTPLPEDNVWAREVGP
jgi:FkbM family methyltransferase